MKSFRNLLLSGLCAGMPTLAGCSAVGSYQSHDVSGPALLSANAKQAIGYRGILRNPVVVIHGLLGARLTDSNTGKEIWGTFDSNPTLKNEELRALALPMGQGKALSELTNGTVPEALLETVDIRLLGFPVSMKGYGTLISLLESYGYVPEVRRGGAPYSDLFVFYYDWRRDLPENAARLNAFLSERRVMLQKAYENSYGIEDYDVRFDLVTHSMGGLLARYFLRYGGADLPADGSLPEVTCAGAKMIDRIIQIGTPNGGYLDTLLEMCNGLQLVKGTKVYPGALLCTFPAYYQMLPHPGLRSVVDADGKELDIYDPQLWIDMRWGLADPAADAALKVMMPEVSDPAERQAIALDHLAKCLARARQFCEAMSVPDPECLSEVTQILFLGDSVPTHARAKLDKVNANGRMLLKVIQDDAGDGKVLEISALFDLKRGDEHPLPFVLSPVKWLRVVHLRGAHMGIIDAPDFGRNLGFYLLQMPTENQLARAHAGLARKKTSSTE